MTITLFGRLMCSACADARAAIGSIYPPHFAFRYWCITGDILQDGPAALAEADYHDVYDVLPVVIVERDGQTVRRWDGEAPSVSDITEALHE